MIKLKPKVPGTIIRDPATQQPLPDEGKEVPHTTFWARRLRDGDVVRVDSEAQPVVLPNPIPDSADKEHTP